MPKQTIALRKLSIIEISLFAATFVSLVGLGFYRLVNESIGIKQIKFYSDLFLF